ncbi:endonuclease domain-containing protein [Nocardia sp. NPDC059180]|uniref:endonuclease domain-containing protein n=1 Tax=Nocardia sp. NPDC059180 TaxID=3346761 RepID=UPI0036B8FEF4
MGWRQHKVAVEYDGAHHWTNRAQRAWDIDREAHLSSLGWTLIRVSATQLTTRPQTILTRTHQALARSASGT